MNQLIEAEVLQAATGTGRIDAHQLAEARREASTRRVPVVGFLEETYGLEPDQLIAELGRLLRMPVLTMERLRAFTPAFEVLPFNEAVAEECALFRSGEEYILAVAT